ncbi:proton-coupled folate transporter-like [Diadema setosum]|uniref:proton-coupled folate transporter-like n=1 Tax=Diadema setosum TaxID=31175 RepID=UPI003B3A64F5
MGGNRFNFTRISDEDDVFDDNYPLISASESDEEDEDVNDEENRAKKRFPSITVEPVILLFFLAYSIIATLRAEYISLRIRGDFGIRENAKRDMWTDNCNEMRNATNGAIRHLEAAQAEASYWLLIYNLVEILPALFVSPLIGAWSDRIGRKKAMLLPTVGYLIGATMWVIIVSLDASKSYLTIAHFVIGIFGDFPTLVAICNAYLCDIARPQSQTCRMIILGIIIEFSTGLAQIGVGYWVYFYGFRPPFWFIFATILAALFYIIFVLDESHQESSEKTSLCSAKQFDDVVALFANADSDKRTHMVSYLVVLGVHMMLLHSAYLLVLLYVLSYPLCWTSIAIGIFVACSLLIGSIGTLVGGRLFESYTDDLTISQVGIWSSLTALTFIAFSHTKVALFVSAILGSFRFLTSPAMRSRMSKLARKHEHGVMMACASSVESLGNLIGPSLFNLIYSLTIDEYSGLVFALMAALYVPLSALVTYFQWIDVKRKAPSTDASYEMGIP